MLDWHQLWEITSAPDNVPIVALLFFMSLFTPGTAFRQALANDRLIAQLEADPQLAKTHHRKTLAVEAGLEQGGSAWPYLLRIEFLAAIIVTVILMVWSITLNAPLEELANPNLTMNPAKAPWYFLGLQEMLVYFDPWMAGVVMPTLIIVGLMVIPYIDANPLGSGYYTWKQRRFAIADVLLRLHAAVAADGGHRHVHSRAGMDVVLAGADLGPQPPGFRSEPRFARHLSASPAWGKTIFGALVMGIYFAVAGLLVHKLITWNDFNQKIYQRMSFLQYMTHADVLDHHAVVADQNTYSAFVPDQVHLGNAVV